MKRYAPTSPLRAMQLMMQVSSTERAKGLKNVRGVIEKWETKVMTLSGEFKENLSPRMKAAILINLLPHDVQEPVIQQLDKIVDDIQMKDKVLSIVVARLALKNLDEMDVDEVDWSENNVMEEVSSVGKGGIHRYQCGTSQRNARPTPEPNKGGKSGGKGSKGKRKDGKGPKGKGKGEWSGYEDTTPKTAGQRSEMRRAGSPRPMLTTWRRATGTTRRVEKSVASTLRHWTLRV